MIFKLKDNDKFLHFILTETENMGKLHVSLAHQLMENLEQIVRDFKESQREKRKKVKISHGRFAVFVKTF